MERKLLNKRQAKKQANGKQLNAEDAARLAYLKAKNKAAKAAAAAANDANDSSEEIVFDHSRSSSTGHGATKVRSDNTDSHGASATKSAATEAKAQLNERGQQLNGLSDKTADLASAAGEFEAMCKELRRKSWGTCWCRIWHLSNTHIRSGAYRIGACREGERGAQRQAPFWHIVTITRFL